MYTNKKFCFFFCTCVWQKHLSLLNINEYQYQLIAELNNENYMLFDFVLILKHTEQWTTMSTPKLISKAATI